MFDRVLNASLVQIIEINTSNFLIKILRAPRNKDYEPQSRLMNFKDYFPHLSSFYLQIIFRNLVMKLHQLDLV